MSRTDCAGIMRLAGSAVKLNLKREIYLNGGYKAASPLDLIFRSPLLQS